MYDLRNQQNATNSSVPLDSDPKVVYFETTLLAQILGTLAQHPKPEAGRVVFQFLCRSEQEHFAGLNLVLCGKDTGDQILTPLYLGAIAPVPNVPIQEAELWAGQGYFQARNQALSADPRFRNEYQGYAHQPATIGALLKESPDYVAVHLVFDGERTNLVLSPGLFETPAYCPEVPGYEALASQVLIEFGTMCCPPQ
ncbi:hypothetical protein GCM10027275_20780 [Rhabdobacter roseus]